jgi:hypothetical protein
MEFNWQKFYPWAILGATKCQVQMTLTNEIASIEPAQGSSSPEFEDRKVIVEKFLKCGGTRMNLKYFGKNAHLWIIYHVTNGRFRTDKNKYVYYFTGERSPHQNDAEWMRCLKKNNSTKMWRKMDNGLELLKDITNVCNEIYDDLLRDYNLFCTGRDMSRNNLKNFRTLPEFVAFQTHRSPRHTNHYWSHVGAMPGGGKHRLRSAKCQPNKIHSVHWYLKNYHDYLGTMTRRIIIKS